MRGSTKVWLIIGAVLVALGLIVFTAVAAKVGWNFKKLETSRFVTERYEVSEEFDKISIDVDITDIELLPSEDETCSVVCYEKETLRHAVTLEEETLKITTEDNRKWYQFIEASFGTPKITVYLPKSEYTSLNVKTDTGDVRASKELSFETVKLDGDTSDVKWYSSVSDSAEIRLSTGNVELGSESIGRLKLTTSTGDIKLSSLNVTDPLEAKSNTGKISLGTVNCKNAMLETETGDTVLKNVKALEKLSLKSSTGDVKLEACDAGEIYAKTSTGDISGSLLSEKIFITKTSTGDVDVPKTVSGGRCEIITSTGDIKFGIIQ